MTPKRTQQRRSDKAVLEQDRGLQRSCRTVTFVDKHELGDGTHTSRTQKPLNILGETFFPQFLSIYLSTYLSIHTYIHTYIHIYIYIYIHTYKSKKKGGPKREFNLESHPHRGTFKILWRVCASWPSFRKLAFYVQGFGGFWGLIKGFRGYLKGSGVN